MAYKNDRVDNSENTVEMGLQTMFINSNRVHYIIHTNLARISRYNRVMRNNALLVVYLFITYFQQHQERIVWFLFKCSPVLVDISVTPSPYGSHLRFYVGWRNYVFMYMHISVSGIDLSPWNKTQTVYSPLRVGYYSYYIIGAQDEMIACTYICLRGYLIVLKPSMFISRYLFLYFLRRLYTFFPMRIYNQNII